MLNLSDRDWKEFGFADIFEIKKGFYNKKPRRTSGAKIPFLGATDSDNGITIFLTLDVIQKSSKTGHLPNEPLDRKLFPGHAIAVTNNGSVGHAYYQATQFTCSHDINPLYLKDHSMSKLEALFLIPLIEQQGKLFQYARKWRPSRMVNSKIMLPVNKRGLPDYEFMVEYERAIVARKYAWSRRYVEHQLEKLGEFVHIADISDVQWTSFALPKLFEFERGREKNMKKLVSGAVPLVSAKKINNGVKAFVGNPHKIITSGNTVTLNNDGDGGAGLAYYQPSDFALDTHVTALHAKQKISSYALQFIAASLSKQHELFGHGRSISLPRAKHLKVMLPTMSDGTPDYSYMDQYVKNKMNQKYNHYLKYLNASVIGSNKL